MTNIAWFFELLPEEKIVEEEMLKTIQESYKKFWYTTIETASIEKNKVLLAKWWWEIKNQIFWLYWLAQWCEKWKKDYSLHFDLTLPFWRYVVENKNKLTFPFKRNQIQKVRRWERPQRWRFREFYQTDIDVIRDANLDKNYLFYDAEIIFTLFTTLNKLFKKLNLYTDFQINLNNKKIILWIIESFNLEDKTQQICSIIDKKDKINIEQYKKEFEEIWVKKDDIDKLIQIFNFKTNKIEEIENKININNDKLKKWLEELKKVTNYLNYFNIKDYFVINLWIIRGLDYYTWTVFETFIMNDRKLWSIAWWWSYENFTKKIDSKTNFSWVGWSIWITRLQSYIFEKVKTEQKTSSKYLLLNLLNSKKETINLYLKLQKEWKNIEMYPNQDKIWKQLKYADKKWIKFCVIMWENELEQWNFQIKNMETWDVKYVNL